MNQFAVFIMGVILGISGTVSFYGFYLWHRNVSRAWDGEP